MLSAYTCVATIAYLIQHCTGIPTEHSDSFECQSNVFWCSRTFPAYELHRNSMWILTDTLFHAIALLYANNIPWQTTFNHTLSYCVYFVCTKISVPRISCKNKTEQNGKRKMERASTLYNTMLPLASCTTCLVHLLRNNQFAVSYC